MQYKLGRKPRTFDPRVLHYAALRMRLCGSVTPIPAYRAWSKGMPSNLGMMGNGEVGDCADAGLYHNRQVQTFVTTGKIDTQPDSVVLSLYSKQGGYVAGDPSTDNGSNLQELLAYYLQNGIPLADGATDKLIAYFEVDPTNRAHVNEVINDCGGIYFGMNVPVPVVSDLEPPPVWDFGPGEDLAGGHCMDGTDYGVGPDSRFTADGITVNSWGGWYLITPRTWNTYVDEAYGLVTRSWVEATGKTPLGMSVEQLEEQMQALKAA